MRKVFRLCLLLLLALRPGPLAADPATDWPVLDLQAAVAAARAAGDKQLLLTPGTYRVPRTVNLEGLSDFTLDGQGATLVWGEAKSALRLSDCRRLTVRRLTIDYQPLPFTQGTILALDLASAQVTVRLHQGYPSFGRGQDLFTHVFNAADRLWKTAAPDLRSNLLESLGDNTFRLQVTNLPGSRREQFLQIGDLLAFDWRGETALVLRQGSADLLFEDLTFHASPGCAVVANFCGAGHVWRRLRIARGPLPPGASEPRLLSTCADGLHYACSLQGPTVLDCDFSFMGDDSVNCHAPAIAVLRQESPTALLLLRPYPREDFAAVVQPGLELRFLAPGNFAPLSQGRVVRWERVEGIAVAPAELKRCYPAVGSARGAGVYRVTLAEPLSLPEGAWLEMPSLTASGFVVRNSYFHDHRARGLRLQASHGLVEDCRFERLKQNAITIGAEYGYWREAGWGEDVVIRNNRIQDVCQDYYSASPTCYAPGAIASFVRLEPGRRDAGPYHRGLTIVGNRISGSQSAGVWLSAVTGATVRDNTLAKVARPAIQVSDNCREVQVDNNAIDDEVKP